MVVIPAKDLMNYIPKPHKRSICGEKNFFSIYVFYTPSLLMQEKEKEKKRILGYVILSPLLHPQSQFKKCSFSHRLKMNSLLPLRGYGVNNS